MAKRVKGGRMPDGQGEETLGGEHTKHYTDDVL